MNEEPICGAYRGGFVYEHIASEIRDGAINFNEEKLRVILMKLNYTPSVSHTTYAEIKKYELPDENVKVTINKGKPNEERVTAWNGYHTGGQLFETYPRLGWCYAPKRNKHVQTLQVVSKTESFVWDGEKSTGGIGATFKSSIIVYSLARDNPKDSLLVAYFDNFANIVVENGSLNLTLSENLTEKNTIIYTTKWKHADPIAKPIWNYFEGKSG